MNERIVEGILDALNTGVSNYDDSYVLFSRQGYDPVKFSDDNFHPILKNAFHARTAFIDGGNIELLKAPNFSLQFVRIASLVYNNARILDKRVREYYILVTSTGREEKIYYKAEAFPLGDDPFIAGKKFMFDSDDEDLSQKNFRASITSIGNIIRNLLELKEAERCTENADVIVRDGNLQATNQIEEQFFDSLYSKAGSSVICGVAKTTDMLTDAGNSVSDFLSKRAVSLKLQEWYYHPLVNISSPHHKADVYFARFHALSRHIFRLDICNTSPYTAEDIMLTLKSYSTDPVFLGYPYPLIKADRLARVSLRESEYLKMKIISKLGTRFKDIEGALNSLNAHEVLDNIG